MTSKVTVSRFDSQGYAVVRFGDKTFNVRRRFSNLSGARAAAWYEILRDDWTSMVFSSLKALRRDLPGYLDTTSKGS